MRPRGRAQLDGHVHRDAELGVDRPLDGVGDLDVLAGLVLEQVDGVRGVVPEQVVGPAAGLAERVHVRAAEEVGLHVHLLDGQLARADPAVDPLVRRVEPAGVPDHADQAGLLLHLVDLAARPAQLSASGISTWTCLPARIAAMACCACSWVGVHRMTASTSSRARTSSRSVEAWSAPYFRATSSACSSLRLTTDVTVTPSMFGQAVEVLDAERAGSGECDSHGLAPLLGGTGRTGREHEVPDRGVGRGDVVEAVQLLDGGRPWRRA